MFEYPVELSRDTNGTFLATFPDIPEAITFGETTEDALEKAAEALEVALAMYIDDWRMLPEPSRKKGPRVSPSLQGSLKLAIYKTMRIRKMRKIDLVRKMDTSMMQVDRLLDLTHASRMRQIEDAINALGFKPHIQLEDA